MSLFILYYLISFKTDPLRGIISILATELNFDKEAFPWVPSHWTVTPRGETPIYINRKRVDV